jgi:hypothetical protein
LQVLESLRPCMNFTGGEHAAYERGIDALHQAIAAVAASAAPPAPEPPRDLEALLMQAERDIELIRKAHGTFIVGGAKSLLPLLTALVGEVRRLDGRGPAPSAPTERTVAQEGADDAEDR